MTTFPLPAAKKKKKKKKKRILEKVFYQTSL